MSEGEESNDQMDTNDTNENSVSKLKKIRSVSKFTRNQPTIIFFSLIPYFKFFRMNLRLKVPPIRRLILTAIAAKDLTFCSNRLRFSHILCLDLIK